MLLYLPLMLSCSVGEVRVRRAPVALPVEHRALPPTRVLLVTIDGVRPEDVLADRAQLEHLFALVERGVGIGFQPEAPMLASGPNFVSLPGYREIFTGRPAAGCTDNDCEPLAEPTLLDELRAAGVPRVEVASIASWEVMANAAAADADAIAISAGRHGGASREALRVDGRTAAALDEGARASAEPGSDDYRPDAITARLALTYAQARHPRFLHVGLGDTDEHAHHGDAAAYRDSLRAADAAVGALVATLSPEDLVIVTSDHGRSHDLRDHGRAYPESQRSWLIAAGASVQPAGLMARAPAHRLADIAPTIRAVLGLARDRSPSAGAAIAECVAAAQVATVSRPVQ